MRANRFLTLLAPLLPRGSRAWNAEEQEDFSATTVFARSERMQNRFLTYSDSSGLSQFIQGNLGQVELPSSEGQSFVAVSSLKEQGAKVLKSILAEFLGGTGHEDVRPAPEEIQRVPSHHRVHRRTKQHARSRSQPVHDLHIRYYHFLDGLQVEGSSMVLHISGSDGSVFALNGEIAPVKHGRDPIPTLTCQQAIRRAQRQLGVSGSKRVSKCELSAVYGDDGYFQKAWKSLVRYRRNDDPDHSYQVDEVFASLKNGQLVGRLPTIHGGRSMETSDCNSSALCSVISTSADPIAVSEALSSSGAVDAHNNAIYTYNYYFNEFGRDSINGRGMKLVSRANYANNVAYLNNAFWDGTKMTYGNGNPSTFHPFSHAVDVVAHELTHGVTQFSSGLVYRNESGALNEAMSDIFGVTVKRLMSRPQPSMNATWLLASDLYRRSGYCIRNMADPASKGHVDHYSKLYTGPDDNGGVHTNSGIMNLAFALAVTGGSHPRKLSTVVVPALHKDFDTSLRAAASIWYYANTACLTRNSQFLHARQCTLMFAGNRTRSIAAAWDAVGVVEPPTPSPTERPTKTPTHRPSRAPAATLRPTTAKLSVQECLQRVQSSCKCSDFIDSKSRCWAVVARRTCRFSLSERQKVKVMWAKTCRRKKAKTDL